MQSQSLKSTLHVSNESINKTSDSIMPTYTIALIAASCTVFSLAFIYYLNRNIKNKVFSKSDNNKQNDPIREVWSNPNTDITNDVIAWDKE
jgi:hypothetical protein